MRNGIVLLGVLFFSLSACMKKGEVKSKEGLPGETKSVRSYSSVTANSLAFDQAFIDFVYHAGNSLRSTFYIQSILNDQTAVFMRQISTCNTSVCTNTKLQEFNLDGAILDDYLYSALASAIILEVDHPELLGMAAASRSALLEQAFYVGYNSNDPKWSVVKSNIENLSANFNTIIKYKAAPGGAVGYISCIVNELKGIFDEALKITGIVSLIQKGEVAKTIGALKSFLRTTLGRTVSWIGLAFLAYDIFECMWDVAHSNATVYNENRKNYGIEARFTKLQI